MDLNMVQEDQLRCKKILTKCSETNNEIITGAYNDESKISFINIGERIILDKNTALTYSSPITITKSTNVINIINELNKAKLKGKNKITCEEFNNIELTLTGRIILNDLTRNYLTFGLELLTKKDLILILNEILINQDSFKHVDCNIRMIRGSGDVIIDVIKKILKNVLCIKDPNVPTDDVIGD